MQSGDFANRTGAAVSWVGSMKLARLPLLLVAAVVVGGVGWWRGSAVRAESPVLVDHVATVVPAESSEPVEGFRSLAQGIEYGRFKLATASALGDSLARIVRVDPKQASLRVGSTSLLDHQPRAASEWAGSAATVAVINTSMYADDYQTSVGYFRVDGMEKNGRGAGQQNSAIGWSGHEFRLFNFGCADVDAAKRDWPTLVQSIRMLGCSGENVWAEQPRAWSSALIGMDKAGRALFIHTRSPYTMHALVDLLLALPLDLVALHYCEGGPEASLYVRSPGFEEKNVGSFETGFRGDDSNAEEWPLPNVLIAESSP